MTGKAEAFKFTTNIPVQCAVAFIDVRPGKPFNDPKKGPIVLPAQVSLKGTFDGLQTIAYLKGPVWKNVKALVEGGIILPAYADQTGDLEAVTGPTSLTVIEKNFTAELHKGATDRYENMVFTRKGGASPVQTKRLTASQAASAPAHVGALPTKPFDEPTAAERAEAMEREMADGGYPADWDSEGGRPVNAPPAAMVQGTPIASQKEAAYLALFDRVAKFQAEQASEHQMPFDAASVQAMTFSIAKGTGIL